MAKITRKLAKIFGVNASTDQRAVFGSLFAGSSAFSTDPETIQSLSNYTDGWFSAAIGGNSPAIEDMNALQFVFAYQIAYLMQAGIAEWNSATTYYIGSFANVAGVSYVSLTDSNLNNLVTDPTNWKKVGGNILQNLGDIPYADVNGGTAVVGPNTTALRKFLAMTGTGSAGAAPQWTSPTPPTVQLLTSGSGTYTLPAGVAYIKVRMVGGGGGGSGSGQQPIGSGHNGGDGSDTTFGTTFLVASGGKGAVGGGGSSGKGGAGGAASLNTGANGIALAGSYGGSGVDGDSGFIGCAGSGGTSPFGGAGGGANNVHAGAAGVTNSGSGGGGGGYDGPSSGTSGYGGGSGGYVDVIIPAPLSTYSYSIGAAGSAGSAGTNGFVGGAGGSGIIIVEEYYQ